MDPYGNYEYGNAPGEGTGDPIEQRGYREGRIYTFRRRSLPVIPLTQTYAPFDWVFYDRDNLYPNRLVAWAQHSPLHSAILQYMRDLIVGGGLFATDGDPQLTAWLSERNDYGCTPDEILYHVAYDMVVFNAFTMYVHWGILGNITQCYPIDTSQVRVGKLTEVTHKRPEYFLSCDWQNRYIFPNEPYIVKAFNPNFRFEDCHQLIYDKRYAPQAYYYPTVEYSGAIQWIELEYEFGKMNLNLTKKAFVGTTAVVVPQSTSDEEMEAIEQGFADNFQGVDNAGSIVLMRRTEGTNVEITQLKPNITDNTFTDLFQLIYTNISAGHGLSAPELAGISTGAAQLGGAANVISVASEYFFNNRIIAKQDRIIHRFKEILRYMGLSQNIAIRNRKPLQFQFSESLLLEILTPNELRKMAGYEPLQELTPQQQTRFMKATQQYLAGALSHEDFLSNLDAMAWREQGEIFAKEIVFNLFRRGAN